MDAMSSTSITTIANQSLNSFSNSPLPVEEPIPAELPTVSSLTKVDAVSSKVNTGEIPAVKVGLVSKIATGTTALAKNTVSNTINASREMGNVIAKDVLPKPEPLSTTLVRNKFLSAVLVGGFVNGVTSLAKVANGEYTQEEAKQAIIKDTSIGAISGLSFASGMGLTATVLGGVMGGVPLSLAALTIGTLASFGATELAKNNIPFFESKKTAVA